MAVRSKDELMQILRAKLGEDSSDDTLTLMEDISDTYDELDNKAKGDGTDWKTKYENNDAEWRKRYRDRFYNSDANDNDFNDDNDDDEKPKVLTFEQLFKEG